MKGSIADIWHLSEKDIDTLRRGRVVLSMSGGKDSTACALLLERHGIEFEGVFMDTGWEHPALYKYLSEVLEPRFGSIKILKSDRYPGGMVQMIRQKSVFPTRNMRFCTAYLKSEPFISYIRSIDDDVISVVGIRREEGRRRSSVKRWDVDEVADCDLFRPLVDHTFDDVILMHQEGAIPPNPLYLQGATRVGCFPCINSRKSEIDQVGKLWPERIDQIDRLEQELSSQAQIRFEQDQKWRKKTIHKVCRKVAYDQVLKVAGVSWPEFRNHIAGRSTIPQEIMDEFDSVYDRMMISPFEHEAFRDELKRALRRTFFASRTESSIREVLSWASVSMLYVYSKDFMKYLSFQFPPILWEKHLKE